MKKPAATDVSVEQKITVTIGGHSVELTRKEAEKLRNDLNVVLNDQTIRWPEQKVVERHIPYPIPYRSIPMWSQAGESIPCQSAGANLSRMLDAQATICQAH